MAKKKKLEGPSEADLYMRKEERTKMGDLSQIAFGSRGKWRKLAIKLGMTKDGMRLQMEAIVGYMKGQVVEENKDLLEKL